MFLLQKYIDPIEVTWYWSTGVSFMIWKNDLLEEKNRVWQYCFRWTKHAPEECQPSLWVEMRKLLQLGMAGTTTTDILRRDRWMAFRVFQQEHYFILALQSRDWMYIAFKVLRVNSSIQFVLQKAKFPIETWYYSLKLVI